MFPKTQVPWGNICFKFFLSIIVISYLFLYKLATYHWKGFEESYKFVNGSISIKTHIQKLCSYKVSNTFIHRENMVAPWGNLGPFFLGGQVYAWGNNLNLVIIGSNYVPLEVNVFKILCDHNFYI
jgi:hypothetical protein